MGKQGATSVVKAFRNARRPELIDELVVPELLGDGPMNNFAFLRSYERLLVFPPPRSEADLGRVDVFDLRGKRIVRSQIRLKPEPVYSLAVDAADSAIVLYGNANPSDLLHNANAGTLVRYDKTLTAVTTSTLNQVNSLPVLSVSGKYAVLAETLLRETSRLSLIDSRTLKVLSVCPLKLPGIMGVLIRSREGIVIAWGDKGLSVVSLN